MFEVDEEKETVYMELSEVKRTREFNKSFIDGSKSLNVEEYDERELVELERD